MRAGWRLGFAGAVAVAVAVGCGGFADSGGEEALFPESIRRIKRVNTALQLYATDYDDCFPLASKWMDATLPYHIEARDYVSPAFDGTGKYGYALNELLAGQARNQFEETTVTVFDSTDTSRNATAGTSTLPSPPRYGAYNTICLLYGDVLNEPPPPPEEQIEVAMGRMRQASVAVLMYATDYDDHAPPASTWMDATWLYTKTKRVYRSPVFDLEPVKYGTAFSAALSNANLLDIENPSATFLLFDSTLLHWNAAGDPSTRPVPGRHFGINVFTFLDGRVEHD